MKRETRDVLIRYRLRRFEVYASLRRFELVRRSSPADAGYYRRGLNRCCSTRQDVRSDGNFPRSPLNHRAARDRESGASELAGRKRRVLRGT